MEECVKRDDILRPYFKKHDWYVSAEFHLVRRLIMKPPLKWIPYAETYPLIFDFEWPVGNLCGDLIYTDGCNNFLVAEVKSMSRSTDGKGHNRRVNNRDKRLNGKAQTEKYTRLWHDKNPQVKNTVGVFVTDANSEDGTEWQVHRMLHLKR